jgi:hypothetical protein
MAEPSTTSQPVSVGRACRAPRQRGAARAELHHAAQAALLVLLVPSAAPPIGAVPWHVGRIMPLPVPCSGLEGIHGVWVRLRPVPKHTPRLGGPRVHRSEGHGLRGVVSREALAAGGQYPGAACAGARRAPAGEPSCWLLWHLLSHEPARYSCPCSQYNPPGNYPDQFAQNIFPAGTPLPVPSTTP